MDYPKTINHNFDGVACQCSVTKDHNDEYVIEVVQPVDFKPETEGEVYEGALKGRFVKFPADHKF